MPENDVPKKLITLKQAARRLGMQPGTLYRWKCCGQNLTFYKIGGGVKVDPEELDRFIQKSRISPQVAA